MSMSGSACRREMNEELYYILNEDVFLRKWAGGPPCFQYQGKPKLIPLAEEEYAFLRKCDGNTPLKRDSLADRLEFCGMVHPVEKGSETLVPGQVREYPNHRLWGIELNITDACNYNCLHCFHAADNTAPKCAFTYEETVRFLDEMKRCGVQALRLTGGEPTLHPQFRQVLQDVKDRGIFLKTLVTNGSTMDEKLARFISALHPDAEIMISFDGVGFHDWMRQHAGSEERALTAIRNCKEAGLRVLVNMNVNRKNRKAMFDNVKLLDDMGVDKVRIIKTTEAPRWELNAKGQSLTVGEYYDFCLDLAAQVKGSAVKTTIIVWQCLYLSPAKAAFSCLPVKAAAGHYDENTPICEAFDGKTSVMAHGDIFPCSAFAGYCDREGIASDNVKTQGLQAVLSEGSFLEAITRTTGEKRQVNEKCRNCRHFEYCQGGCPALSVLTGGSMLAPDAYKCAYFENGWYERFCDALDGWKNISPME